MSTIVSFKCRRQYGQDLYTNALILTAGRVRERVIEVEPEVVPAWRGGERVNEKVMRRRAATRPT